MSERERIEAIVALVEYKDWSFRVEPLGDGHFVQVLFNADGRGQRGRKWYISKFACRSEIVQTLLLAVLTAEEHEAREKFTYRGAALFGPHKDVDELRSVGHAWRDGGP